MKSRTLWYFASRIALAAVALAAAACGGSSGAGASPAPRPVSEVQRTHFDPALGVDLSKMLLKPSGLYVEDLATGTGAVAAPERTIVVRYVGWLPSGKTVDQGEITVALGSNKVIRAWEEGLLGMRVGGRRLIVSPPSLAYGAQGAGNDIPPNTVLVFVMQLQAVY